MTTAPERPRATVDDIEYPTWCDLRRCDPSGWDNGGEHVSHGTMWPSRADAAQTTISLIPADDIHAITKKDVAETTVRLEIFHTEYASYADVHLSPDEARLLAAALTHYADDAARDNRIGPARCTAGDLRDGRQR